MTSIIGYLKKWAQLLPEKVFLTDGDDSYSFIAFYEAVGKFSTLLLSKGIKNGDFVVIHLSKKIEHLIAYCALLNIGAISVHVYPEREDEYVKFAVKHTDAKAVISDKFKGSLNGVLVFVFELGNKEPTYCNDANEVAYVMFTSGTTSSPKAVLTTQKNVLFVANTLIKLADMRENEEREIILLPLGSTGGLGHFHACMMLGNYARLYRGFYSDLNAETMDAFFNTIKNEDISGVLLTPGIIQRILRTKKESFAQAATTLRYALANVMPMKKETIKEFLELLPNLRFCTYYGSTEASRSIVNICRQSGELMHLTGKPADGVMIEIRDKNENGEGEIYIKGGNVMKGYLHDIGNSLDEGWFASGDIGKVDKNGFITVLGRAKDTISMDGLKLFPSEVEDFVSACAHVVDAGVCKLDSDYGEAILCLAIVLDDDSIDKEIFALSLADVLKKHFRADRTTLYSFKVPKRIYFEMQIPKTELGKIKRDELSKLLASSQNAIFIKG